MPGAAQPGDDLGRQLSAVDLLVEDQRGPLGSALAQQLDEGLGLEEVARDETHEVTLATRP